MQAPESLSKAEQEAAPSQLAVKGEKDEEKEIDFSIKWPDSGAGLFNNRKPTDAEIDKEMKGIRNIISGHGKHCIAAIYAHVTLRREVAEIIASNIINGGYGYAIVGTESTYDEARNCNTVHLLIARDQETAKSVWKKKADKRHDDAMKECVRGMG